MAQLTQPDLAARLSVEPCITPERLIKELLSEKEQLPASPEQRIQRVEAFERARDAMALELARNLAKDNITVEEFLRDVLD